MKEAAPGINTHTRIVAWLKVGLPLLALVILSTLFLMSRDINPDDAIPYADVDVADRIRQPRMTTPSYATVMADGSALTFAASQARPATDGAAATASAVEAAITAPDGRTTRFSAATATLDQTARQLDLAGGVTVETALGYVIRTDRLIASLDRTDVQSAGPITAQGPLGSLDAGSMRLTEVEGQSGNHVLLFQGRVNLVYLPRVPD